MDQQSTPDESATVDEGDCVLSPPEPTYPPSPEVTGIDLSVPGPDITSPTQIEVEVEYWPHRGGGVDPYQATVEFRVSNGTATLRDVDGDGRLVDQLSAIITATETVADHHAVTAVRGLPAIREDAVQHIESCREAEAASDGQ